MIAPARGTLRAARAAAVAGTVLALASAAHVAAGGGLPDALTTLALLAITTCAAHLLTRRRLSGPALLGVLGAGQVALHEVLAATCALPAGAVGGAGHHGQLLLAAPAAATGAQVGAAGAPAAMLAAHTAATLLAALVLARGEAALWALRAWWRPLLVVLRLAFPPPPGPRRTPPPAPPAVAAPSLVVVRRAPRRGPPPRRQPSPPRARSLAASP
ncbi:hypothetical protein [Kineococcus sp. SYSU DK004]|uniref:hypothetical protein n=1 Tax=Kineococcus sp. SYSU DK004 TaxID=3383125 RepID=UPI003D7D985C